MMQPPGKEICNECRKELDQFPRIYPLRISIGFQEKDSLSAAGLSTVEVKVCPDCLESIFIRYHTNPPQEVFENLAEVPVE